MSKSSIGEESQVGTIHAITMLIVIFIYFATPKSLSLINPGDFRLISSQLTPWFAQRYILIAVSLAYATVALLFLRTKCSLKAYALLIVMLSLSAVQLTSGDFVIFYVAIGSVAAYLLLKETNGKQLPRFVTVSAIVFCTLYTSQYIFYRVGGRITASFLDPNISGYYLFLCYVIFRYGNQRFLSIAAIIAGALSLSRNFYLAVFLFEIIRIQPIRYFFSRRATLKSPLILSAASLIVVIITSLYIVSSGSHSETIGDTAGRLTNINDGSNYSRANANIKMLERMMDGEFIFFGNGNEVDTMTEHRPHNAFLRAIYRYGLALSIAALISFFCIAKHAAKHSQALFISLFAYYSILNDFITGMDLVLLLCVSTLCFTLQKQCAQIPARKYTVPEK
jgi:hypothetical protein